MRLVCLSLIVFLEQLCLHVFADVADTLTTSVVVVVVVLMLLFSVVRSCKVLFFSSKCQTAHLLPHCST